MRILIVGAGAVGGYYGGRLAHAGRDVTFLLRASRASQLRERGLTLLSPHGNVSLHPAVVSASDLRESITPFDLIVITTKSYALPQAMQDFAPAVDESSVILPVLNGMAHLALLDSRFGAHRVLGGSVRILADMLPNGDIEHQTPLDELIFGFRTPSSTTAERSEMIRGTLSVPGITVLNPPDVLAAMWQKWWLLAAMNTACALADGAIGEARRTPYGAAFNRAVLDECMAVAQTNGYIPAANLVHEMRTRFDDPKTPATSSMYRDMTRNAPVEADHILGDFLRHAGTTPAPLLLAAYTRLKVYETRREDALLRQRSGE